MSVRSELRAAALERAGHRCEWPSLWHEGRLETAHLVQSSQGGLDLIGNVVILCESHHLVLDNHGPVPKRRQAIMELLQAYTRNVATPYVD